MPINQLVSSQNNSIKLAEAFVNYHDLLLSAVIVQEYEKYAENTVDESNLQDT